MFKNKTIFPLLLLMVLVMTMGCTPTYEVNLEAEPEEFGEVKGGGTYNEGEIIEVEAEPKYGYEFDSWIKDGEEISGENFYEFEVKEDVNLKATFDKIEYEVRLEVSPEEAGEVSGSGTYDKGEEVIVEVEPKEGFNFSGWEERRTKVRSDEKYQFEIEENKNLTAKFDITAENLESLLDSEPLKVIDTNYLVQHERHKALYPDMLQAVIKNNSEHDIKNAVVAFVAWDENNLPVKIEADFDLSGGRYLRKVDYSDINLVPGDTFGEDKGFSIDENSNVDTFKAIAVSHESFDGETWENPYFDEFRELYEGERLE